MAKHNLGLAPGSLVYTGKELAPTSISVLSFRGDYYEEFSDVSLTDLKANINKKNTTWFNVVGLADSETIAHIGQQFDINNLLLEDALNVNQLPKIEELGNHLFVSLKMLHQTQDGLKYTNEHLSFILGDSYLITLQEKEGDVFDSVRKRIQTKYGKIRNRGNDYLLYALLDTIVDNYLLITKMFEEKLDAIEAEVFANENDDVSKAIIDLRKQLNQLRKFISPTTLVTQNLLRSESKLIAEEIRPYLADLQDHSVRSADRITDHRELLSSYMDLHLSLQGKKMNEIMKVLTIVAAIFIPLTFLAGIYGMNFSHMPELQYPSSYPILLGVMLGIGIGLILYFKKKKWL